MASSSSGLCWPSRFPMRLMAFFLGALVVGMLLAALKPRSAEHLQALIYVYGTYKGATAPIQIAADLYYVNNKTTKQDQAIPTYPKQPAYKTDTNGSPVEFDIEQVDIVPKGNGEAERRSLHLPHVHWSGNWVTKMNGVMNIQVDLPYPKPTNLHY